MQRQLSSLVSIVATTLAFLVIAGCGGDKDGQLTFAVGGAPAELDFWDTLVTRFEEKEGVSVNLLRQPTDSDQRRQGLVVSLKSRQPDPDVFLMDVAWLPQFAASNWLEPLADTSAANRLDVEAFFANVVDIADRYNGELIGLPIYIDGGVLYYRTDLLAEQGINQAPETWQQLVDTALKAQQARRTANKDFFGYVWQGAQYEGLICNFLEVAASNGGGITGAEGTIDLDRPANRKALEFMRDLIHDHKISPKSTYTEMKEEEVRTYFQQGNALYERNWPYAWSLHQSEDSPVRDKVGIAPLPHFRGHESASTLGGWHVGLSKTSDSKPLARKFIAFITSFDVQKELALELGWNPGRKDVYQDEEVLAELPHFERLRSVFDHARPRPPLPYYTQLSQMLQRHLNAVLAGRREADEALRQAQTEAEAIVRQYER